MSDHLDFDPVVTPVPQESIPTATITFGTVGVDANNSLFVNTDSSPLSVFTDYIIENRFERDGHVYMMGLTSPGGFNGDTVAFAKLSTDTLLWVSDWTACRINVQPDIPDPTSKDTNWVLLDIIPTTRNITVGPDGITPLYRISGIYVYGHKKPNPSLLKDIFFGVPPWLNGKGFSTTVQSGKMKNNISNPG